MKHRATSLMEATIRIWKLFSTSDKNAVPHWVILLSVACLLPLAQVHAAQNANTSLNMAELQNGDWHWMGSDTRPPSAGIEDPENYMITFLPEQAVIKADCNRGAGSYAIDGTTITFKPIPLTRALCIPVTRDHEFVSQLQVGGDIYIHGDLMWIRMPDEMGTMYFAHDPELKLVSWRCGNEDVIPAVFTENNVVHLWYRGDYHELPQVRSGSGIRYENDNMTFHSKGDEALLNLVSDVVESKCVLVESD